MLHPLQYVKLMTSSADAWDGICTLHPTIVKTFAWIVLPMSLLPPAMLLFAGADHPLAYQLTATYARWKIVAAAFFVTELLTVPLMGWVIKSMAASHRLEVDFKDTFLLAALAAIPLWCSSIALVIANMWLIILALIAGLLLSANVLYRGTVAILKLDDDEEAQALSSSAFSTGALMWAFLCAFVLLPLMA